MALWSAIIVGSVFAAGVYLLLRRNSFDMLLGVALISNAVNLLIITAAGWHPAEQPPLLEEKALIVEGAKISQTNPAVYADALPQALILTAIVIGFGLLSFLMVLVARGYDANRRPDMGEISTEQEDAT